MKGTNGFWLASVSSGVTRRIIVMKSSGDVDPDLR
jgi:hypothetical protein